MNLRWDDLRLFLAVHEQGSLSAAARLLKLGQPTLSRRIAELEAIVGDSLFERHSQGVSLTSTGQKLLPAAQSMAEWANSAELSVKKQSFLPEGKVRIAAPPSVAYTVVVPMAVRIRQYHPQIQIEILSGIETLNLARGEADLSLRSIRPNNPDLICVNEISCCVKVYVSREYSARLPVNPKPEDLDWICWATPYDGMSSNQDLRRLVPDFKTAFTSDDYLVQLAACNAGVGAMILPQGLQHYKTPHAFSGLIELPIDLGYNAIAELFLVCHKRHRFLPKVRLVMDFFDQEFNELQKSYVCLTGKKSQLSLNIL